jgi:hypothetical protein
MSQPNIVETDGVVLFLNTVVGYFIDGNKVITVGTMSQTFKEAQAMQDQRNAELADALRVVIDEAQHEGIVVGSNMERAVLHALSVFTGKPYTTTPAPSPDATEFGPVPARNYNRRKSDMPTGAYLDGQDARDAGHSKHELMTEFDTETDRIDYTDGYMGLPYRFSHEPDYKMTPLEAATYKGAKAAEKDTILKNPPSGAPYPMGTALADAWNTAYNANYMIRPKV